jgi:hypothetical protein
MAAEFYVYEHKRLDSGIVFYVGKGSGDRCKSKQGRNKHWWNIVEKVGYEISMLRLNLDEELSFLVEGERIDQLRRLGYSLCNVTDGGGGMSGFKMPLEVIEKRANSQRGQKRPTVSAKLKGRPKSLEHRQKLALARLGTKASEATKLKMSETRKGRPSTMLGKKHSEETKKKIRDSVTKVLGTDAMRKKISDGLKLSKARGL